VFTFESSPQKPLGKFEPLLAGIAGLTKPGEVGDFFTLVSMKSPNFCQKAKF
jgi:hypothetical protein